MHEHTHEQHEDIAPQERTEALLGYMIDHNAHHVSELEELAGTLEGTARKRLLEAIDSFRGANEQLRGVLELVKGGA